MLKAASADRHDRIVQSDAEWRAELTPRTSQLNRENGATLSFKPGDP